MKKRAVKSMKAPIKRLFLMPMVSQTAPTMTVTVIVRLKTV